MAITCSSFWLALFASLALVHASRVTFDVPANPPPAWSMKGRAEPASAIDLIFALKQPSNGVRKLESVAMDVSTPSHPSYGKHWSLADITELMTPPLATIETVRSWLLSEGIPQQSMELKASSDFLVVHTNVSLAEQVLGCEYRTYEFVPEDGRPAQRVVRIARHSQYTLPSRVSALLDFVAPTVRFPNLERYGGPKMRQSQEPTANKTPNITLFVTPSFLRELYQVGNASGTAASGNSQGVAGFIQQFWSPDDLAEFFDLFASWRKGDKVYKQVGKNDPGSVGAEASLDVQYLMGVGAGINTWVWYTANNATPFLSWLLDANSAAVVPHLFSVSYGEYENGLGKPYAYRVNTELQKLAARGVSIMVASGDSGTGGNCSSSGRFSPDFPASSPWVTAVGGMVGGKPGSTPTEEVADYISGGGFSDLFSTPSYQKSAAAAYLKHSGLPDRKYFNASGRGYPDVSAQSEAFTIVVDLIPLPGVGGTSCATPTFSAVVALLNELRLSKGKPALGFLNPLIYQTAPAHSNSFNDATFGSDVGCSLTGFPAKPGWDAVTGWGSPNYRLLKAVVESLQ